jgi:hypothetical protein
MDFLADAIDNLGKISFYYLIARGWKPIASTKACLRKLKKSVRLHRTTACLAPGFSLRGLKLDTQ